MIWGQPRTWDIFAARKAPDTSLKAPKGCLPVYVSLQSFARGSLPSVFDVFNFRLPL